MPIVGGVGQLANMVGGGGGGAGNLGNASGSITIDTSQAQAASVSMRRVGQDIERSMGRASAGVQRFGNAMRSLQGEIAAIGLAGGILSGLGLSAAGNLEEAQIRLEGMVGSQQEAVRLMDDLRKQAARAGIPFSEMLRFTTGMLPALEGNTEELERFFDLARRLASTDPERGLADAAIAIREALASGGTDLISLSGRFEISRTALREAIEQTGSFADGLDLVLNRMGATTETADRMGRTFNASFRAARDAAVQLLATGFTPLLEVLTPLLQQTTEWLQQIRQTNPAIATFGAGIAAIAAVGAPSLLLLNQMVEAAQKLRALGLLGAAGTFGIGAAAVASIPFATVGGARAVGRATGNEALAEMTLRQAVFQIAFELAEIVTAIDNAMIHVVRTFLEAVAFMRTGAAEFVSWLGEQMARIPGPSRAVGAGLQAAGSAAVEETQDLLDRWIESLTTGAADRLQERFANLDALQNRLFPATPSPEGGGRSPALVEQQMAQDRLDAIHEWAQAVQEIERNAAQARLSATQQYEQQRSDIIASYELQIAREAEDFARQRARQQAQLERNIADIRADAAEREAEWWADLQERISDLRADAAERIADIEEDYRRNRERAERDHRDRLLDAAARLDARAVAEEQRRFRRQTRDMEEDFQDRVEQERENLQERIEQEQEAHEERLREAREADEERIRDMREAFRRQQEQEDEDRAIRLRRMEEDHQRQLAQLARAHQDRLRQISQHAAEERQRLDQEFVKQLAQLGIKNQRWLALQKREQDRSLELFEEFWDAFEKEIRDRYNNLDELSNTGQQQSSPGRPGDPVAFRHGGRVDYSGLAMVHGSPGRPEYMLSPETTLALQRIMGGQFSQADLVRALSGGRQTAQIPTERGRDVPGIPLPRLELPRLQTSLPEGVLNALTTMAQGMAAPQTPLPSMAAAGGGEARNLTLNLASGAIQVNEATRPGTTAGEVRSMLLNLIREAL